MSGSVCLAGGRSLGMCFKTVVMALIQAEGS